MAAYDDDPSDSLSSDHYQGPLKNNLSSTGDPNDNSADDLGAQEESYANADEPEPSAEQGSPDSPANAESAGESLSRDSDLYKPDKGRTGVKGKIGSLVDKFGSSKKRIILGIIGPIGLIIVIIFLMSMLKIPNYAANIAAYRLARTAMEYAKTSAELDVQKIALDTGTKSPTKIGTFVEKMNKYRPAKVLENLKSTSKLEYVKGGVSGEIVGVKVNGEYIFGNSSSTVEKLKHPLDTYKSRIELAAKLDANLGEALKGYNSLIRGKVAAKIRADWGISLNFWEKAGSTYRGTKTAEAQRIQLKDLEEKTSGNKIPETPTTSTIKDQVKKVEDALKRCDDRAACRAELFKGHIPAEVESVIAEASTAVAGGSFGKRVLGVFNTAYALAVPLCLIFEGSLEESSSDIDSQSAVALANFNGLATAGDQQTSGNTTMEAVNAYSAKIGDGDSNPDRYRRGAEFDTSNQKSPQASIGGDYTLANAFLGDAVGGSVNAIAEPLCKAFTNVTAMIGVAVVESVITFLSGGTAKGLTLAIKTGGREALIAELKNVVKKKFFAKIVGDVTAKTVAKTLWKGTWGFGKKFFKDIAKIEGATIVARLIVLSKVGLINDGSTSAGGDYKDLADMGGDIQNNELSRQGDFGGPLLAEDVAADDIAVASYLNNQEKSKPVFDRYFATSNPRSLVSKISYQVAYIKGLKLGEAAYRLVGSINLSSLADLFFPASKRALAADAVSTAHYGIVQWGWTEKENDLIASSSSFGVLENAAIVENAPSLTDIIGKYEHCFTDTMGTLLSNGDIVRDKDGNVLPDEGDCSPNNLGPDNNEFGTNMVFRWRLYQKRNTVLDHNLGIQEPTADSSSGTSTQGTGSCEGLALGEKATSVHGGSQVVDGHEQYQLPDGNPGYVLSGPRESQWGSKELVETIWQVGLKWAKVHPDKKFVVRDLDESEGHQSHVKGVDVDIIGCPIMGTCSNYDQAMAIELGKLFMEAGNINMILYDDNAVSSAVNAYAKQSGLAGDMHYYGGHLNHFHVRILKAQTPQGCQ